MEKLKNGLYIPILTPFKENGEVDESGLRSNIDWYLELGVQGLICTGSTGSFEAMSDEEMKSVFKITTKQVSGKATVLAGTAATTTKKCIDFSKFADSIGVHGVMIVPPFYCTPSEEELFHHYEAVAESIRIPILIYNNPRRAGVDLTPEWLANLAKRIQRAWWVKDSSGDIKRIHQIISLAKDSITPFIGHDDLALLGLLAGARGWVATAANIVPEHALNLVRAAEKGDVVGAREVFHQLLPVFDFIKRTGKFVSVCQAGLNLRKHVGGSLRRPRLPLKPGEEEQLEILLKGLGLL